MSDSFFYLPSYFKKIPSNKPNISQTVNRSDVKTESWILRTPTQLLKEKDVNKGRAMGSV